MPLETADIVVVGAGAAGLMAAVWAARTRPAARVVTLDGARTLGAKILVAGGGRCNVTHDVVDEHAFAGDSPHAIRKVLRQFPVDSTVEFFRDLGVTLKREDTGKLFPTTDSARTVLDALLRAARDAGVHLRHPWRVGQIVRTREGFEIRQEPAATDAALPDPGLQDSERLLSRRVILATGGLSLPKTGSDGGGYALARALGHTVTVTHPALVPLTLPRDHPLCALAGVSAEATVELLAGSGRRLVAFDGPVLCAHFGLTGPAILDISRYYLARADDGRHDATLAINWLPSRTPAALDADLASLKNHTPLRFLSDRLPERLGRAICAIAGVEPTTPGHQLTRERRRALAHAATQMPIPVLGSRGYLFAEVTAGGIPLSEVRLETMESRVCPGLHLCGEVCNVDGRIGGYNFQWAWSSGFVAGRAMRDDPAQDDPRA